MLRWTNHEAGRVRATPGSADAHRLSVKRAVGNAHMQTVWTTASTITSDITLTRKLLPGQMEKVQMRLKLWHLPLISTYCCYLNTLILVNKVDVIPNHCVALTRADCVHILRQVGSPHVNSVLTSWLTDPPQLGQQKSLCCFSYLKPQKRVVTRGFITKGLQLRSND